MVRGFYQLGAGMLTYNNVLSNIGNNLANVKTPGYKKQEAVTGTFQTMLVSRVDGGITPLGSTSMVRTVEEIDTIHSPGTMESTGRDLDFCLLGAGFFAVQGPHGLRYTRRGSFNIDEEGYLVLGSAGRVLGRNGPIRLDGGEISADQAGRIYADGVLAGELAVFDFDDYNALQVGGEGMYTAPGGTLLDNPQLAWQALEGSNVNLGEEMTAAIAAQRGLQSCSQLLKIYDQVLAKAVTEIGRA